MTITQFETEANGMNLKDVNAAIALAECNLRSMKPEARLGLQMRLCILRERQRRLTVTDARIAAVRHAR